MKLLRVLFIFCFLNLAHSYIYNYKLKDITNDSSCYDFCDPIKKSDGKIIRSYCALDQIVRINKSLNIKINTKEKGDLLKRLIDGINNYSKLTDFEKQHLKARIGLNHLNPKFRSANDNDDDVFKFLYQVLQLIEQNSVPTFEVDEPKYALADFVDRIALHLDDTNLTFPEHFDLFKDNGSLLYEQKIAKFVHIYSSYNTNRIKFIVYYPSTLNLKSKNKCVSDKSELPLFFKEDIVSLQKRFHENEIINEFYSSKTNLKCMMKCIEGYTCVDLLIHGNKCINNKFLIY